MQLRFDIEDYLKEIQRYEMITLEEEQALATRIRQGDKEAIEALKNSKLPFIVSLVRQYHKEDIDPMFLIHHGNQTLEQAAVKFAEEAVNEPFIKYAIPIVRKGLDEYVADHNKLVQEQINQALEEAKKREEEAL